MSHGLVSRGPAAQVVRHGIHDDLRTRIMRLGLASLLAGGALWLATLAGIVLAPWWAKGFLAVLNAVAVGILFIIGHDACHGALLPCRRWNRVAGRLCLLPSLHPFTSWIHNHNGLHHGFTNVKEKDPGFPPLDPSEYAALPGGRRWLYRIGRSWYGLGLLYFTNMWLRWEVFPNPSRSPRDPVAFRRDRLFVAGFALAWVMLLAATAWWQGESMMGIGAMVLVGFLVPQVIWNWLIGFITMQQHTHPEVPWYSERDRPAPSFFQAQVRATPHLVFPGPFRFLMRHVMEHTAHHADPAVPLYFLAGAQASLEDSYDQDIVRVRWTVRGFLRTLRVCRLYNYEHHHWVDYDGTPTSPILLHKPDPVRLAA
jgi:omega-6 fatty acid desaturase (delta-12 desaturase)